MAREHGVHGHGLQPVRQDVLGDLGQIAKEMLRLGGLDGQAAVVAVRYGPGCHAGVARGLHVDGGVADMGDLLLACVDGVQRVVDEQSLGVLVR